MQLSKAGRETMARIWQDAFREARPIQATFELTPRCGLNCRMCYVHLPANRIPKEEGQRELTAAEWLRIGEETARMGVLQLCVTGGDPLCHPQFPEIWEELSQMGFRITLQTNGFSLTENLLELLERYPPQEAKITLYGASNEIYRQVCRVEGAFDRVDGGVQSLRELGIPIQMVTTFVKQNLAEAQAIADYARTHGSPELPWYYSTACYPSLRGADSQVLECALDPWTLGYAESTAQSWQQEPFMRDDKKPCQYCKSYRTGYCVVWNGDMRFCMFLDEPRISTLNQSLEECWRQLLEFQENLRWPTECYTCEIRDKCRRCVAHLACLNGGLGKLEQNYCEMVRKMLGEAPAAHEENK